MAEYNDIPQLYRELKKENMITEEKTTEREILMVGL